MIFFVFLPHFLEKTIVYKQKDKNICFICEWQRRS